jgi:hypothetical protein
MLRDGVGEGLGDQIQRLVPGRPAAVDLRVEKPAAEIEGLAERRALRAQAAGVRRVRRVARHGAGRVDDDAAADAAIGTGGANRIDAGRDGHQAAST